MVCKIITKDIYGKISSIKFECEKCNKHYISENQAKNCDCKLNQINIYNNQLKW